MGLIRIDPLTKRRFQRFRRIKRGYYSLIVLVVMIVLSMFANVIANRRAIVVYCDGQFYFPTFKFYEMNVFGQVDEYGFDDTETNYSLLAKELKESERGWVIMPIIPHDPYEPDFDYDEPPPNAPDDRHLLGTDNQGRDVLARILYGFRISIFFSLALVFVAQTMGTVIGSTLGFFGGWYDSIAQRFIEIWAAMPFLYVVILVGTFLQPSFWTLLAILALFQWIGITYYMRTEMYREKSREYCLAARSFGASRRRLMFRHLLPNCLTPIVTFTPFAVVAAIGTLTGLDYLGFGLPAPTPSWGEMIGQALESTNRDKLWLSLSPLCAISITLFLVTMIGESIREAFDPKQYARYR